MKKSQLEAIVVKQSQCQMATTEVLNELSARLATVEQINAEMVKTFRAYSELRKLESERLDAADRFVRAAADALQHVQDSVLSMVETVRVKLEQLSERIDTLEEARL